MRLARRETILVALSGILAGALLFCHGLLFPLLDKRERLLRAVTAKEAGLREMAALAGSPAARRGGTPNLQEVLRERGSGFALFSFLEQEAGHAGIKGRIKSLKPSVVQVAGRFGLSEVEMTLEGIGLEDLVRFLYRIEKKRWAIQIQRIAIKRQPADSRLLDAVIRVMTPLER